MAFKRWYQPDTFNCLSGWSLSRDWKCSIKKHLWLGLDSWKFLDHKLVKKEKNKSDCHRVYDSLKEQQFSRKQQHLVTGFLILSRDSQPHKSSYDSLNSFVTSIQPLHDSSMIIIVWWILWWIYDNPPWCSSPTLWTCVHLLATLLRKAFSWTAQLFNRKPLTFLHCPLWLVKKFRNLTTIFVPDMCPLRGQCLRIVSIRVSFLSLSLLFKTL